jgi:hypothetical protein
MILRRFMQHIREQNWFAVGLDVIVVIVGIFLGLQVQQQYEEGQLEQYEKELLGNLKNEIETNIRLFELSLDYLVAVKDSGERAYAFLESDKPCQENCWSLLVDFFIASQSSPAPTVNAVAEEMRRLGLPRSKEIKKSIDEYYIFSEGATTAAQNLRPKYREFIRELMTIKAMRVLWQHCYSIDKKGLETLKTDCKQQLSDTEIDVLLNKFRQSRELSGYLSYWIGMHYVYIQIYENRLDIGAETISVIEKNL